MRNEKISNEDILNMIGEMTAAQDTEEFARFKEAADTLDIAPDEKILAMARQYDQKKNRKPIKRWISVMSKLTAVFVIGVVLSLSTVDSSHHIMRHGGFIMEEHPESGSVSFKPEKEFVPNEELNLWYPSYLPNGFELIEKRNTDSEIFMLFGSNQYEYDIMIFIEFFDGISMNHDTEFTEIKAFEIEKCSGYLTFDKEGYGSSVFWLTDDERITIDFSSNISESEMLKIVQGMELKK